MEQLAAKNDVILQLQREVLSLQGFKGVSGAQHPSTGLGPIEQAFPGQVFPTGAVHEFLSREAEDAAATSGFMAGILGRLMRNGGTGLWISTRRTIFPPALKVFGIEPERIIFVDVARQKEALWAVEEALKCDALTAVIGELNELSFTESRRLQLVVEQSRVTGFIHRYNPKSENTVACVSRWKIKPLPGTIEEGMPGVGFPRWNVQLLKVRNGKPGTWQVGWSEGSFRHVTRPLFSMPELQTRKAG